MFIWFQSFLLLFIVGSSVGYEKNEEMISCNSTADCELYINQCQITDCQNGFCEFGENTLGEGCCTNPSDCIEKDCETVICSENICVYEEFDCTFYKVLNDVLMVIGILIFIIAIIFYCGMVHATICKPKNKSGHNSSREHRTNDNNTFMELILLIVFIIAIIVYSTRTFNLIQKLQQ